MKKFILILLTILLVSPAAFADRKKKKANIDTDNFRYDIEYCKPSGDGTYLVKVWSYSRRPSVAVGQARKNAVHGIIFKGCSSNGESGSVNMKPLAKDASIINDKSDFFNAFFSDAGNYNVYVTQSIEGNQDVIKVGKDYKIGVIVNVNKDQLRKHLEDAGIIRSLTQGF